MFRCSVKIPASLCLDCIKNGTVANYKNSVAKCSKPVTKCNHCRNACETMCRCQLDGYPARLLNEDTRFRTNSGTRSRHTRHEWHTRPKAHAKCLSVYNVYTRDNRIHSCSADNTDSYAQQWSRAATTT